MWWLTIPVMIYSAGILYLWLTLRRHSGGDSPEDDSLHGAAGDVVPPAGEESVRLLSEKRTGVTIEVAVPGAEEQVSLLAENHTGVTVEVAVPGAVKRVSLLSDNRTGINMAVAAFGKEEHATPLPEPYLRVTVVVAARNEESNVTPLLESLVRQDYPPDLLEIIIVNDNSTDRTPVAVSEFMQAHRESSGISMRLIFNPFPGKKQAIRLGVSRSAGELILTTDADCTVGPGWVRAHVSEYEGGRNGNLVTHILSGNGEGSVAGSIQPSSLPGAGSRETGVPTSSIIGGGSGKASMAGESLGGDGLRKASMASASVGGDGLRKASMASTSVGVDGSGQAELRDAVSGGAIPSMVLAPVVQRPVRGFWPRFGVFEFSALQAVTEATALAGHPVMCNAANMSFARDVYLCHAGELRDDLPSGDDIFLLHAVRRGGGAVRFAGSRAAAVETAAAVTAAALLHQRTRWASKAWYYRDPATLILAAATAACNAAVTAAAVGAAISVQYLPLLGAFYAIRTVPDYLIIARNIKRSGAKIPLVPFVVSELIYPFWFMTVAVISILPTARRFRER